MPRHFAKVQGTPVLQFANSCVVLHSDVDHFSQLEAGFYQCVRTSDSFEFHAMPQTSAVSRVVLFGEHLSVSAVATWFDALPVSLPMPVRLLKTHAELPVALELRFSSTLPDEQIKSWQDSAQQLGLELVYQQHEVFLDQPGVLVMDMDSTAIQIECIDEIAKLAGTGEQVAAITARAMNGELDFAQSLKERVGTLKGAPEQVLADVLAQVPLMPGLEPLCQLLLANQWQVVIASGGFTYFTQALQQRLGLSATYANQLEIIDGYLTGQVLGDIVDAERKADVVVATATSHQIPLSQTVAIGDGANDLPMLAKAALGVAFHAKPKVQAQAKASIRHGSLLQLAHLLGAWKA